MHRINTKCKPSDNFNNDDSKRCQADDDDDDDDGNGGEKELPLLCVSWNSFLLLVVDFCCRTVRTDIGVGAVTVGIVAAGRKAGFDPERHERSCYGDRIFCGKDWKDNTPAQQDPDCCVSWGGWA